MNNNLPMLIQSSTIVIKLKRISEIDDGTFQGLTFILFINLSENFLTTISQYTFNGLNDLIVLYLMKNK